MTAVDGRNPWLSSPHDNKRSSISRVFTWEQACPPTMQEMLPPWGFLDQRTGVTSKRHKGVIHNDQHRSRGIVVCDEPLATPSNLINMPQTQPVRVPVWVASRGRAAPGRGAAEEILLVDPFFTEGRREDVFSLVISGESMIEAGIHDGDYVFVRASSVARPSDMGSP